MSSEVDESPQLKLMPLILRMAFSGLTSTKMRCSDEVHRIRVSEESWWGQGEKTSVFVCAS